MGIASSGIASSGYSLNGHSGEGALNEAMEVPRRAGLSRKQFVAEFVRPNRPVVLTDVTRNWRANQQFSFDFFRRRFPDVLVDVRGRPYRLQEILDRIENGDSGPDLYPCKLDLRDPQFGTLAKMVGPRPPILSPDRTHSRLLPRRFLTGLCDLEIFFGGAGGEFPYLHYDYLGLYAIINQLHGRKEFTLFSPEQQAYLYPCEDRPWVSQIENHHNPDLDRFPLFKKARSTKVILGPGESLFIPKKWYHTAQSLEPTISIAMDQLCHFNWDQFTEECLLATRQHAVKHRLAQFYLEGLGHLMTLRERLVSGL